MSRGLIAELGSELALRETDDIVEAKGGLLMPGLIDHHIHLFATAAARASIPCGPEDNADEQALAARLQQACVNGEGMIRGVGFHQSLQENLSRDWLDKVCGERPVRIQHRSGKLWILNSAAIDMLSLAENDALPDGAEQINGRLSGRFYDLDRWLGERLPRRWPSLAKLSEDLASYGITAVTDTGVDNGLQELWALQDKINAGEFKQRLQLMGREELQGSVMSSFEKLCIGPLKLYLREAELPDLSDLTSRIASSHAQRRPVAFHCVTRVEIHFAIAALREAGVLAGDRIEHASVADDHAIQALAELGITVVTQPHFLLSRGDQYLRDVDTDDIPLLYRGKGFIDAGVRLAGGSDAPYGGIDPWLSMRAAVQRRSASGEAMNTAESLSPEQGLSLYMGSLSSLGGSPALPQIGEAADLCLLDKPWQQLREDLDSRHVRLTLQSGRRLFDADLQAGSQQ